MGVYDHRDLHLWRLADEVRRRAWKLVTQPGYEEHAWLRSQLRRSAQSACANIAEGFARYRPLEFAHFLDVAKGSLAEVIEHLSAPVTLSDTNQTEAGEIVVLARRAQGAITKLIKYLRSSPLPPDSVSTGGRRRPPRRPAGG
jgi:four helix bundle protein